MAATIVETLGAFVAERSGSDIPERVRHGGRRALLNGFGLALNAAADPAIETAVAALSAFGPSAQAGLIGRPERLDPPAAAFVNAIGMNLLDFDDTHLPTIIHPTAPVAPAVLALAEARGLSGAEVLDAFVLGAEICCRVGDAVSPGHYARGWHITSTCGVFGAAAASARLLGLDAERTAQALGVASSLSSGTIENLTTAGKNASVGNAARSGILAALLAQSGYVASPTAIEGKLGWARASGDEPDVARALAGLGEDWAFELNALKPYPAGIVFHSTIDAALALRETHGIRAEEIDHAIVRGDALLLARGSRPVATHRDARVSLHHAVATVFLYGGAGIADFEMPRVMAPEAVALRARVRGELDASLPPGASSVEIVLSDGRRLVETVVHPRGSIERPMSDRDVEDKLRTIAEGRVSAETLDRIVDLVWHLDEQPEIATLMRLAAGG
ncbi:MmgE/PrpD family protein [Enterovirga rhinocerotis]|uniref:2-methylcitrate dehydratase PrpD n=1 Tax=Enterovirga rhinocerotis TaxID=1339210 RepID=A0A4R7C001_9HYPH|nr:MmgE/PrpD family protein [Enterovirga rhinocerotis]TDR89797.1 2-methylcitrate dehydratase PrpD [Enterovirga rhinocerotis]